VEYTSLELDTDKPNIDHAEHVKEHPPGKLKKMQDRVGLKIK